MPFDIHDEADEKYWQELKREAQKVGIVLLLLIVATLGFGLYSLWTR